jgi:hypothetical protein
MAPKKNLTFQGELPVDDSSLDSLGSWQPKPCREMQKLKEKGWFAATMASLAGLIGVTVHDGVQKITRYEVTPSYQTLTHVEKTLDSSQSQIPALSDKGHTSQVVKNQLTAHLNAIALFQPSEPDFESPEGELYQRLQQEALIHDLDHMRYTEADQRVIEKLTATLEKMAFELHQDGNRLNIQDLSQTLASTYTDYADQVLARHLKQEQVDCYKRLAEEHIQHIQSKNDGPNLLYLLLLGMTGFTAYRYGRADSRQYGY